MKFLRGLGLTIMVVTIAFIVGEGFLRLFLVLVPTPSGSPYLREPYAAYRLRPTPIEDVDDPDSDHINQLGFRDREHAVEKCEGAYRILGIGDSFVYGNVPLEDNFLRVAEDRIAAGVTGDSLAAEMILMGLGGYAPDNEVGVLESVGLDLDPDLVILNFFVGNDVIGLAMPARVYRGQLYFTGSLTRWVHFARKSRIFLLAEFTVLRRFRAASLERTRGAIGQQGGAPRIEDEADAAAESLPAELSEYRISGTYIGYQKKRINTYLREPDARMCRLWSKAEDYILEFDRLCRENDVPWMLHVIPAEVQVDPIVADIVFRRLSLDPDDYDLTLPQVRLHALCEGHGISVLDPLPLLESSHRPKARLYVPNDTHWNVEGNRLAGELLGDFILERFVETSE